MPLTPNFSIFYRDTSTPASLETESALQADSIDDALTLITSNRAIQTFRWANATARAAQTGMQAGDIGLQLDTGIIYRFDGSVWNAWSSGRTSFTPSFTNLTLGNATVTAWYVIAEGIVTGSVTIVFGSSTSVGSGTPVMGYPVTQMTIAGTSIASGDIVFRDSSAGADRFGKLVRNSDGFRTYIQVVVGSNLGLSFINSTTPWTWAVGDEIVFDFRYPAA